MARYHSSLYRRRRRRTRNRIYIILALLIIAAVIASIYGYHPFGKSKEEASEILNDISLGEGATLPAPEPNLSKVALGPVAEPDPEAAELIDEAMACLNAKPARITEARDMLNELLGKPMSGQQRQFVKDKLSELADTWLFSRKIFPQDRLCGTYRVKPRDQLRIISKQFKVPHEILMRINNIQRPEALRAGETMKVINGPFHTRIYRSAFMMDLYLRNTFVRSFPVGLGRPGRETPTGLWVVEPGGKVEQPTWRDPDTGKVYHPLDPDYPLGSRWIRLKGLKGDAVGRTGIAFHGWKDPNLMAEGGSRGCIRLDNGDVILLYNLLMPGFSQVEIVE